MTALQFREPVAFSSKMESGVHPGIELVVLSFL